jgi:hypothetical protein
LPGHCPKMCLPLLWPRAFVRSPAMRVVVDHDAGPVSAETRGDGLTDPPGTRRLPRPPSRAPRERGLPAPSELGWLYRAQELHDLVTDLCRGLVLYPVAHVFDLEGSHETRKPRAKLLLG